LIAEATQMNVIAPQNDVVLALATIKKDEDSKLCASQTTTDTYANLHPGATEATAVTLPD
jgi:hypothetical protein